MTSTPKAAHLWDRDPHDWYDEPERTTAQLLTVEAFPGWTHDPCAGGGNIVRTLLAAGLNATGSDLVQRVVAPWHLGVSDFLDPASPGLFAADNVVFNPPFYRAVGAEACIRRALADAPGKVAAFVNARFLCGVGRATGLYADHPPSRVWIITPRPSCPPGEYLARGEVAKGGEPDFIWLVWDADRLPAGSLSATGWLR